MEEVTEMRKRVKLRDLLKPGTSSRREILAGAVRFIQAVEGRDISFKRACEVYDKVSPCASEPQPARPVC